MITIHSNYQTGLWHSSESGPAAVISTSTSNKFTPLENYQFADRLFSGELNSGSRCDYRCGNLDAGTHKRVLILSTERFDESVTKLEGLHWLTVGARSGRVAVQGCVDRVAREKIEAIMILNPKLIFPSWTLSVIAERITQAAYGGGAVYREEDLMQTEFSRRFPSVKCEVDADDDEGDEWKDAQPAA